MKRRIIIVLICLVILGGGAIGVRYFLQRSSGQKLLRSAELAILAEKYDKAIEYADRYIEKKPQDWRGYWVRARACNRLGRYGDARRALEQIEQKGLDFDRVKVARTKADSYAMAAKQALGSEDASTREDVLREAIKQFIKANSIFRASAPKDEKRRLDVLQYVGMGQTEIGFTYDRLSKMLKRQARTAEAAGDTLRRKEKLRESENAKAQAETFLKQATLTLLKVVKKDPSRKIPTTAVVELCILRKDQESFAAAAKAIMDLEDPPPEAAARIIVHQAYPPRVREEGSPDPARLAEADKRLEKIQELHPKQIQVLLARAELNLAMSDPDKAGQLCQKALAIDSGHFQARLIHAQALMARNRWTEAERELFKLKTSNPSSAAAHYRYALAADRMGKKALARAAMRAVINNVRRIAEQDPASAPARWYLGMAHGYLAESLLRDGFDNEAFADAKVYYESAPDSPGALSLFVDLAIRTDQPDLALEALEKTEEALKDPEFLKKVGPIMVMAASQGYDRHAEYYRNKDPGRLKSSRDKARELAATAVKLTPRTLQERLVIAGGLRRLGKAPQAERMLLAELKGPERAPLRFELGRHYFAIGQWMQAVEHFREAVRLNPENATYRLELARALRAAGMIEQSQAECAEVLRRDASNPDAHLLSVLNDVAMGKHVSAERLHKVGAHKRSGISMALAYLGSGRPELTLEELKKLPDSPEVLSLRGRAYWELGQTERCKSEWRKLLQAAPERMSSYLPLGSILSRETDPEQAARHLAEIPGARPDMVELAKGYILSRLGNFRRAAEVYHEIAEAAETPQSQRGFARLLSFQAWARAGQFDKAMVELDALSDKKAWEKQVLSAKATLLIGMNRREEANDILTRLRKIAVDQKDHSALRLVVESYLAMRQVDDALAVCDQVQKLIPDDARAALLRASVLLASGNRQQAVKFYEQAISLEPGDLKTYVVLARVLEAEQKASEALEVLDRLAEAGETGQFEALFQKAAMFARWGLQEKAIECCQKLAKMGHAGNPRLKLAIGRALAKLGTAEHKEQARKWLSEVPKFAREYVAARQDLATLAETIEEKRKILHDLSATHPGLVRVMVQEMRILLQAGQAAEAVKVFNTFQQNQIEAKPLPQVAAATALQAMVEAGDFQAAARLCQRIATQTRAASWRQLAILLLLDQNPDAGLKMLPEPGKANLYDAFLGLCAAVQTGGAKAPWMSRINQIEKKLMQASPPRPVPSRYRLLASLAAGEMVRARAELAKFQWPGFINRRIASQLVSSIDDASKAPAAGLALLKATLAIDLGASRLGRAWALDYLRASPKCQWAAAVALSTQPAAEVLRQILKTLQPKDCTLAQAVRASLLMTERKHAEAARLYRQAVKTEADNPALLLSHAMATEEAGQFAEAIRLYRQLWAKAKWEKPKKAIAANNAAYLLVRLSPTDPATLQEAQMLVEAAIEADPRAAAYYDTRGWIACLQKRYEEACVDLRKALQGLPNSVDVHYHLGLAEKGAGREDLARWHLAAAVRIGQALEAGQTPPGSETIRTTKLARQALARMDQPK